MDDQQMGALLSLDPEDRYWHLVDAAARGGSLWGLKGQGGWLIPLSGDGFEYLPVWPAERLAQTVGDLLHSGNIATEITMEEFTAVWLDELTEGGVRIGVFPDADGALWDVSPVELFDAIDDEATRY